MKEAELEFWGKHTSPPHHFYDKLDLKQAGGGWVQGGLPASLPKNPRCTAGLQGNKACNEEPQDVREGP